MFRLSSSVFAPAFTTPTRLTTASESLSPGPEFAKENPKAVFEVAGPSAALRTAFSDRLISYQPFNAERMATEATCGVTTNDPLVKLSLLPVEVAEKTLPPFTPFTPIKNMVNIAIDDEENLFSPPGSPTFSDTSTFSPPPSPLFDSEPCFTSFPPIEDDASSSFAFDLQVDNFASFPTSSTPTRPSTVTGRPLRRRNEQFTTRSSPLTRCSGPFVPLPAFRTILNHPIPRRSSRLCFPTEDAEDVRPEIWEEVKPEVPFSRRFFLSQRHIHAHVCDFQQGWNAERSKDVSSHAMAMETPQWLAEAIYLGGGEDSFWTEASDLVVDQGQNLFTQAPACFCDAEDEMGFDLGVSCAKDMPTLHFPCAFNEPAEDDFLSLPPPCFVDAADEETFDLSLSSSSFAVVIRKPSFSAIDYLTATPNDDALFHISPPCVVDAHDEVSFDLSFDFCPSPSIVTTPCGEDANSSFSSDRSSIFSSIFRLSEDDDLFLSSFSTFVRNGSLRAKSHSRPLEEDLFTESFSYRSNDWDDEDEDDERDHKEAYDEYDLDFLLDLA
ncbi:hypothetical protein JCM11251_007380 [Rhodosporidiobolus azoricus]